mgnify:CR=1 FL=1
MKSFSTAEAKTILPSRTISLADLKECERGIYMRAIARLFCEIVTAADLFYRSRFSFTTADLYPLTIADIMYDIYHVKSRNQRYNISVLGTGQANGKHLLRHKDMAS